MARKSFSTPSTVRAWAAEQGLTSAGKGRLSAATVEAFNAEHKSAPYVKGSKAPQTPVKVSAKREGASTITGNITVSEARSVLSGAGVPVGKRGRLSQEQFSQAVILRSEARKASKPAKAPEATPEA